MVLAALTPSGRTSPDGLAYDVKTAVDAIQSHLGIDILGSVSVAADALAIPVTHRIVLKTTGADAEALTLADGTPGQVLTVVLVVDGTGDGTLTPATATGWATIVFADAGDAATLRYVDDTVGWIIEALYGLAAQPAYTLPA